MHLVYQDIKIQPWRLFSGSILDFFNHIYVLSSKDSTDSKF